MGAELEENLGLRYMAAALESRGHRVEIVPFNSEQDTAAAVERVMRFDPRITGLSMVFTGRAPQFCRLAAALREGGYRGHVAAGGHFASFNCVRLLEDFPAFDSVGLGEGEELICALAEGWDHVEGIPGLCYRRPDGSPAINPSQGNPGDLDALPPPKRDTFHSYFGKPIASILSSRGCWRDCAFCSINAWYQRGGGKKFRIRGLEGVVTEMRDLYFRHGIRIFNFQDDNFFLPNPEKALRRFEALEEGLRRAGVGALAIAVKARPDSITRESIAVLDRLGLFRVFLGVENAAENGLRHLNRKCSREQILSALRILNEFDLHVAYNLLLFEPDTTLGDILINLRFMERHIENPANFCRAEAYAGTGLEAKLRAENRLLGDYFGFDYRLQDPQAEAFHHIANHAFFDRNFSDFGLHYFNMQVDFYFQLLRRFHPELLSQGLRAAVRNFIKETNLDTYLFLCQIYDFVAAVDPHDQVAIRGFARRLRENVDRHSEELRAQGERILASMEDAYRLRGESRERPSAAAGPPGLPLLAWPVSPYRVLPDLGAEPASGESHALGEAAWFGILPNPIPYADFARRFQETPDH